MENNDSTIPPLGVSGLWFVMNPKSGTTTAAQKEQIIQLIEKQANSRLIFTERAGHATEITQQAVSEGIAKVIAVGGDGTVNEVARGLLNSQTALGIVPIGSGNGLARHLKIPLKVEQAISFASEANIRSIDACFINDIPFFCTAGIGFDAYVAQEFAKQATRGLMTYVKTAFSAFWNYESQNYQIESQEIKTQKQAFSITFANASQFGNDALIAPKADISDGWINVCSIKPMRWWQALGMGWRLFGGTLDKSKLWEGFLSKEVNLTAPQNVIIHFDGEPLSLNTKQLRVRIEEKALKVLS